MTYSQSPQHYFICTLQHTDQASYACNKVDMLEQFLTKLLGDTEAHNCSNIVYTMLLPWRHNKRRSDSPMQRHWAITLRLWVLMRSSWSVAMAPVWVACQCWSALLFNNTEKYFEDPQGEQNTLCSQWCGFVILQLNIVSCYQPPPTKLRGIIIWHVFFFQPFFFSTIFYQTQIVFSHWWNTCKLVTF